MMYLFCSCCWVDDVDICFPQEWHSFNSVQFKFPVPTKILARLKRKIQQLESSSLASSAFPSSLPLSRQGRDSMSSLLYNNTPTGSREYLPSSKTSRNSGKLGIPLSGGGAPTLGGMQRRTRPPNLDVARDPSSLHSNASSSLRPKSASAPPTGSPAASSRVIPPLLLLAAATGSGKGEPKTSSGGGGGQSSPSHNSAHTMSPPWEPPASGNQSPTVVGFAMFFVIFCRLCVLYS